MHKYTLMQDVFLGLVITSSKSHFKLWNEHTHKYVKQHNASFEFGNISCLFIAVCFKCYLIRLQIYTWNIDKIRCVVVIQAMFRSWQPFYSYPVGQSCACDCCRQWNAFEYLGWICMHPSIQSINNLIKLINWFLINSISVRLSMGNKWTTPAMDNETTQSSTLVSSSGHQ